MTADPLNPFVEFLDKPIFVLTSDHDWAPDWALSAMLEILETHAVPLHLFVTNKSEVLRTKRSNITLGIHPNFLPGSTQGDSTRAIIDFCRTLVPAANTFRSHSISENNHTLLDLARHGFIADSNLVTFLQPGLTPIIHGTGLLRFPVFFEDDVFLWWATPELQPTTLTSLLFTPGLKILNFHPSLVAINAPSVEYFNARRPMLFAPSKSRRQIDSHEGRGVATLLVELINMVRAGGFDFTPFPQLIAAAQASLGHAFPGGLYRWPHDPVLCPPQKQDSTQLIA